MVAIAYAEEMGFYLVDQMGNPVVANIFADYDSALDFCDRFGYSVFLGTDD